MAHPLLPLFSSLPQDVYGVIYTSLHDQDKLLFSRISKRIFQSKDIQNDRRSLVKKYNFFPFAKIEAVLNKSLSKKIQTLPLFHLKNPINTDNENRPIKVNDMKKGSVCKFFDSTGRPGIAVLVQSDKEEIDVVTLFQKTVSLTEQWTRYDETLVETFEKTGSHPYLEATYNTEPKYEQYACKLLSFEQVPLQVGQDAKWFLYEGPSPLPLNKFKDLSKNHRELEEETKENFQCYFIGF